MKRCVSDKRLLVISEGRGTIPERSHVKVCESCTTRLRRLTDDLAAIVQVLRDPPPFPQTVPVRSSFRLSWMPVATVGVAAMLLIWSMKGALPLPWLPSSTPVPSVQVRDEDIAEMLATDVLPALLVTRELGTGTLPQDATNLSYVTAALDGGWPQARCPRGRTHGCDSDLLALLFEEQEG